MKLLLILSMMITFALSNEQIDKFERVLITKTTKESNLPKIKRKLDALGIKMFVQNISSGFYVYTRPINNPIESKIILQKIKTKFPNAKLILINESKNEKVVINNQVNSDDENKYINNNTQNIDNFFININVGSANTEGSTNDANASLLENSGMSYTLEGGYIFNDYLFFSVAYQDASTSDISIVNYYATANYNFNITDNLDIYAGIALGASSLELEGYANSSASTSMLYGLQIGSSYEIISGLNVFASYQAFMTDHTINLPDAGSKIEFTLTSNILLGIGYRF